MLSLRARRTVFSAIVVVVWVSAIAFSAYSVLGEAKHVHGLYMAVRDGNKRLTKLRTSRSFPNKALINAFNELKAQKATEVGQCSEYYMRASRPLAERILRSFVADPIELRMNYKAWRERMEAIAGKPNFMETYAWEKEGGKPSPGEFQTIEKRTCVHDAVIRILGGRATEISDIKVGERTAGPAPEKLAGSQVARHWVYPVTVTFKAPFSKLGAIVDLLVTTRRDRDEIDVPAAFVVIRTLDVTNPASGTVKVTAELDILDFYKQ